MSIIPTLLAMFVCKPLIPRGFDADSIKKLQEIDKKSREDKRKMYEEKVQADINYYKAKIKLAELERTQI